MRARLWSFLSQPEVVDEDLLRLLTTLLLVAGGVFFFRVRALPQLAACAAGGAAVLGFLWLGFHRLGLRPLGGYWPGFSRGASQALLVFCLLPPGVPLLLAALLAALAVAVESVERKALVPLAISGVSVAWVLGWLWHARSGTSYIAPFDFHPLDEPVTLWVRFQLAVEPVRSYAGQVAGPMGATSFGLAALATLLLSYARSVSWHLVLAFYLPVLVMLVLFQRPAPVYLLDAPALVLVALVAGDSRRLPRSAAWRIAMGTGAGLLAAVMLAAGVGYQAFGLGVVTVGGLVAVFQFFGLAGSAGALQRHHEARRDRDPALVDSRADTMPPPGSRPASVLQLAAVTLVLPVGLVLVWRDASLHRSERTALLGLGATLYLLGIGLSLAWLWVLRLPA